MLGLQRRYEERLRNRRWQAGLAYREKHHVKWELKAKMLQRRIEEISGVKTRSSLQEQFIPASNGTSALMSSFAEASALTRQIGAELGSRSLLSDELSISEDNVGAEPVCEPGIPLMVEAEKRRPQKLLNTLNRPGLRFITIFCDDQKVGPEFYVSNGLLFVSLRAFIYFSRSHCTPRSLIFLVHKARKLYRSHLTNCTKLLGKWILRLLILLLK